ncbi:MAG: S-methyl-5'-thioinosine phosphorylase [Pseudomonadota bacterium]
MLAVIGGTGFGEFAGLSETRLHETATAYGPASWQQGNVDGYPVIFLPRHGSPARVPPHRINYRANIQALADAGADNIIAVNAVGSVDPTLAVPTLVLPDQVIDYSWGRAHTFFDDRIGHIDFTFPYDNPLRASLLAVADSLSGPVLRTTGTYGCTQGPRLETAAEIARLARDGCHIVGMTGMPEAALAREAALPYACLAVVVNAGAGIHGKAVDLDGIDAAMSQGMGWVRDLIRAWLASR